MITDYFMITEKSNRLQVIMITDYDYPISEGDVLLRCGSKEEGKYQELIQSSTTPDPGLRTPHGKVTKYKKTSHRQQPRGQPLNQFIVPTSPLFLLWIKTK